MKGLDVAEAGVLAPQQEDRDQGKDSPQALKEGHELPVWEVAGGED